MHQEQSLDLLPVQLHICSTTGRCLHSQVPGRRRCLLSDGFQIFRGTIDFYGPRMYVHVCVHVNLCWAEYVCAHVSACVGPRMCVCVCVCVHVDLCWTEDHIHVKGAGNRHFVLRCVNF